MSALQLLKTATLNDGGDGFADVGDTIDYAFRLRNVGTVTITDVAISDPLVTVFGGPIAALTPGAEDSATFTATYTLQASDLAAGTVQNSARATGRNPDNDLVAVASDDPTNPTDQDPDGDGQPSDPTITSLTVNAAPIAENDAEQTPFDAPITIDPRGNDTDPDGDDLTVTALGPASN